MRVILRLFLTPKVFHRRMWKNSKRSIFNRKINKNHKTKISSKKSTFFLIMALTGSLFRTKKLIVKSTTPIAGLITKTPAKPNDSKMEFQLYFLSKNSLGRAKKLFRPADFFHRKNLSKSAKSLFFDKIKFSFTLWKTMWIN